jgi:hypothetical protein
MDGYDRTLLWSAQGIPAKKNFDYTGRLLRALGSPAIDRSTVLSTDIAPVTTRHLQRCRAS